MIKNRRQQHFTFENAALIEYKLMKQLKASNFNVVHL